MNTLRPFLIKHRGRMVLVLVSVLAVTAAGLLAPWFIRELVRVVRVSAETPDAAEIARLAVFGLAALLAGSYALRVALYEQWQRLSPVWFGERQTGETVSRVMQNTDNLEPLIADAVYEFVVSALLAFGTVVILFVLDPALTALAFLPLPFVVAVVWRLRLARGQIRARRFMAGLYPLI